MQFYQTLCNGDFLNVEISSARSVRICEFMLIQIFLRILWGLPLMSVSFYFSAMHTFRVIVLCGTLSSPQLGRRKHTGKRELAFSTSWVKIRERFYTQ